MKKLKLIYYPIVALLVLILSVFSFVHVADAGDNNSVSSAYVNHAALTATALMAERDKNINSGVDASQDIRTGIINRLKAFTYADGTAMASAASKTENIFKDGKESDETYKFAYFRNSAVKKIANYYVQTEKPSAHTLQAMAEEGSLTVATREVNNIIVYIPGTTTIANYEISGARSGDAVLFTAHMDSAKIAPSSRDAAATATVATMLEQIESIMKSGKTYKNDLIFLFADASHDDNLGINVFLHQFYGFRENSNDYIEGGRNDVRYGNDLTNNIKFAASFDSLGTGDSIMLAGTSENNAEIVKSFAKNFGGSLSNSFVTQTLDFSSDFDALSGVNSFSAVSFGKTFNYKNSADSDKIGQKQLEDLIAKKGSMLNSAVDFFGGANLDAFDAGSDAEYFSVLGLFTITAPTAAVYALGGVILALLIAALVLSVFRKGFDLKATGRGVVLQLAALAATMLATLLLYLILSLILSGFGVFTVQSIVTMVYSNTGLLLGFMLFTVAMLGLFYNLLRGLFSVKVAGTARAGAVIFTFVTAILCFAVPSLGFAAAIAAIFAAAILLGSACFGKQFENKFGARLDSFMPYFIPLIVALPALLPLTQLLTMLTPAILLPVSLLPATLMLMMAAPYVLLLKPIMSRLMEKLPKRTIRVQRTVTEKIEDKAKKGKFTEVTGKKITNEKINWKYRHGVAMAAVSVIAAVTIMISGGVSMPIGATVYGLGNQTRTQSLLDDSLIINWTHNEDASLSIADKAVYKDLRYVLGGYSWNSAQGAYTKDYNWTDSLKTPFLSSALNSITIQPAINGNAVGFSELTITNGSGIESISVLNASGDATVTVSNPSRANEIVVTIPFSQTDNSHKLSITLYAGSGSTINTVYRQYAWYSSVSFLEDKSKDFTDVTNYLRDEGKLGSLRFGIYYEYPVNLNIN